MRILIPLAVCGVLLTGCESTRTTMISDDTALITIVGKGGNDSAKVVDRTVAEAARVTREHGYRYFMILSAADASQSGVRRVPGETISLTPPRRGLTQINSSVLQSAMYAVPDVEVKFTRLGLDVTIRMYHEGDVDPQRQGIYDSKASPRP